MIKDLFKSGGFMDDTKKASKVKKRMYNLFNVQPLSMFLFRIKPEEVAKPLHIL